MAQGMQSVTNFLVPATGSTNAYLVSEAFGATPYFQDFNNVALDGIPFRPSGVVIDNSQGTGDLVVLINEISYRIICPAGSTLQMPYPAPMNHTANITGSGQPATVLFVDYPVIPYLATNNAIPNPLPVTGPLTDAELRAAPLDVALPANVTVTPALAVATGAGTVSAGARMASFNNTGASAATVAGGSLAPGEIATFEAPSGTVLDAIVYDGTGTTLQIATVS